MRQDQSIAGVTTSNAFMGNHLTPPKASSVEANQLANITQLERELEVHWGDDVCAKFHYQWLRHNCFCSQCGNSADGIRSITLLDIEPDIRPTSATIDASGNLQITWPDGHPSEYGPEWLRRYSYSEQAREERGAWQPTLWQSNITDDFPSHDYRLVQSEPEEQLRMLETLRDYGIVKLENVGDDPEETERLAALLGPIHETTVYGRIFEVKVEPVSKLGSKTAMHQDTHHDDAFCYNHPGLVVFHCLQNVDGSGGESTYCDGFAIAEEMRTEAPEAFELLTTVPLQHSRRHPGEIDFRLHAPMIRLDWQGKVSGVRYFDRAVAPLDVPSDLVEPMFAAIREYHRRMVSDKYKAVIKIPSGSAVFIDNHRCMHGRNAFEVTSPRCIRTCNVPRDEFHGRLRDLGYRLGRDDYDRFLPQGACPA